MKRFTIVKDDEIYLDRLRLVQTPWFGVYLHHIYKPDEDRAVHDHPWAFGSLVLRGGYREMFINDPHCDMPPEYRKWSRWSWHRMTTRSAHQITSVLPKTVTLVIVGRKVRDWGFWPEPDVFVPWREYLAKGWRTT